VWVFVNGVLALDLGGLHEPEAGSVTVSDATAASLELTPGGVYAIKVFHAERNPVGSSFKLTLSGFEQAPSECEPICGDAIVSLGEECDDGENDGGYGECDPGCKVGPRCGDGVVQEGEDCDDGNRVEGDGCGAACRHIVVK
jgi:fibro-slime domain-containing protein